MSSQLLIPGADFPSLPPALQLAYEAAAAHVRNPHAPNTLKAYRAAWKAWGEHCAALGAPGLPIEPMHLVTYLQDMSTRKAPNTVRLELAALAALDQAHALATGAERPRLRQTLIVSRWLKGWSREHPTAPRRQAPAVTRGELARVLKVAAEPGHNASRVAHAALYARDRCLLILGVAGGFRVNELCSMVLADAVLTSGGLAIRVPKAKTDQSGHGHKRVLLPQATKLRCPVEAFEQWARLRGTVPGPLFCPVRRSGLLELGERLEEAYAMRMIVARFRAAQIERVTSHSLRATFYTWTKDRPLGDVMKHVNSRSASTALNYQRNANLFDPESNPTSGLLDD